MITSRKLIIMIIGTRPEAIKMAPVYHALKKMDDMVPMIILTGQHADMVHPMLEDFGIIHDRSAWPGFVDLNVVNNFKFNNGKSGPLSISEFISVAINYIDQALKQIKRISCDDKKENLTLEAVLVHGDTTSALAGAMAGFYNGLKIGHVEAGLRSGNMMEPWPEEMNRRMISRIADWHFAPTESARSNLEREGITDNVVVTGNTVIDAMFQILENDIPIRNPKLEKLLDSQRPFILMTTHRRENQGWLMKSMLNRMNDFMKMYPDINLLIPVHPNPAVHDMIHRILGDVENVVLTDPLDYPDFTRAMDRATIIITDSGGVQEESIYLDTPVILFRNTTERPESLACHGGNIIFSGTNSEMICEHLTNFIENRDSFHGCKAYLPYGKGDAAQRIAESISSLLNHEENNGE